MIEYVAPNIYVNDKGLYLCTHMVETNIAEIPIIITIDLENDSWKWRLYLDKKGEKFMTLTPPVWMVNDYHDQIEDEYKTFLDALNEMGSQEIPRDNEYYARERNPNL